MTETLLSPSNVLLFGRKVEDLEIRTPQPIGAAAKEVRAATTAPIVLANVQVIDGVDVQNNQRVLVKNQVNTPDNGIYQVVAGNPWIRAADANNAVEFYLGMLVKATEGGQAGIPWRLRAVVVNLNVDPVDFDPATDPRHGPFREQRRGSVGELEEQLTAGVGGAWPPSFARIYGFSYEGTYYELARPALFLVHGDGTPASELIVSQRRQATRARAPGDPSLIGVVTADFQFAENLQVWSYDKADYTVRMDVETGMFEQVLLDIFFGGGGPTVGGARVSGARVSGARVSGARVSGARLSGSND